MDSKKTLLQEIENYIKNKSNECIIPGLWESPIVGFASADNEYIRGLRAVVHPQHQMPEEVMENAKTILVYFVPFTHAIVSGNAVPGLATRDWAQAYELTNAMFGELNQYIISVIGQLGGHAAVAPEGAVFYRDEVISHWSFRHLAYAAGLGTFGVNNMLITSKGCAGRLNAIITDLDITPDQIQQEEACLFKKNGSCGVCMMKCPTGALSSEGFDRHACYRQCLENAAVYNDFGSSYTSGDENAGSEVCGKCVAGMPCAFRKP